MTRKKAVKYYDDPNGCARGHENVKRYVTTRVCTQCNTEYVREARQRKKGTMTTVQVVVPVEHEKLLREMVRTIGGLVKQTL